MITIEMDNRKTQDHRQELIRGAKESLQRDQTSLDIYNKGGYYTPEDAQMFMRSIEHNKARIHRLETCTEEELLAEISR